MTKPAIPSWTVGLAYRLLRAPKKPPRSPVFVHFQTETEWDLPPYAWVQDWDKSPHLERSRVFK